MKNFKISGVGSETGVPKQQGWNEFFAKYAEDFYDISTQAGLDPRYIVAIGVLEGDWGTSRFAQDRGNSFGYGADDDNAVKNAWKFDSETIAINQVCKTLKGYETPGTDYYNDIKAAGYDPSTIEGKAYKYANGARWGDSHVQQYAKSIRDIIKQIFGSNANASESSSTGNGESDSSSSDGSLSLQDLPPGATVYETSKGLMWCPDGIDGIPGESGYNGEAYAGDANERLISACENVTQETRNRNPKVEYSIENADGQHPNDKPLVHNDIERSFLEAQGICCATYLGEAVVYAGLFTPEEINSFNYHFTGSWYNFLENSPRVKRIDPKDARPGDIMLYKGVSWESSGHAMIYAGNGKVWDQRTCAVRSGNWAEGPHSSYTPSQCYVYRVTNPAYDTMKPITKKK